MWVFDKSLRECVAVPDQHPKLVRIIEAVQYIFRFMVQSYTLYTRYGGRVHRGEGGGSGFICECFVGYIEVRGAGLVLFASVLLGT